MTLNEYQALSSRTDSGAEIWYYTLGLTGEAGEVAELVKKHFRLGRNVPLSLARLEEELGDVLWYLAAVARKANLSLEDIAIMNLSKLEKRYGNERAEGMGCSESI